MIQIYKPINTNYEQNGDMTLVPSVAEVYAVLNDLWEATLKHPLDQEGRWKNLEEDAVVKMPSFNGEQLFRIKKIYKSDSNIACSMEPIFFDSIDDCFLEDVRPSEKNGQAALEIMLSPNSKYSAKSDIKKVTTSYFQDVNFMEALNGDIDQAFIKRWGGEICYDNFTVNVKERIGADNGVELRYGKNIKKDGLTEEIDIREVVTRIKPKSYNGHTMSGTGYVDSPNIEKYPTIRIRTIKFDDVKMVDDVSEGDEEKGIIVCNTQEELDAALRQKCQEQYEYGIDRPKVTINADMVLLQNTDLYKEFSQLETVSLGDTIHCRHNELGIVTDARVIALNYDSIRKKVTSVTVGDFKSDYFDKIESSVGKLEIQMKNQEGTFEKLMQKLIDDMAASITGHDGGNMVITQNSEGKPNGIMIMDTDMQETAKNILWLNLNGIAYSNNGKDGPFNAVWSFEQGGFIADWITSGTMFADRIHGGLLKLGGAANGNGVMRILDASGNEVGSWDKDGIVATSGELAGWKIEKGQIVKSINLYNDMSTTGLASVANGAPVQYWVWMRKPTSATTAVFFVGYKTKSDYLNNADSITPYFRVRTNGEFLSSVGKIGRWNFADRYFTGYKKDGKTQGFGILYDSSNDRFTIDCDYNIEAGNKVIGKYLYAWQDAQVDGKLTVNKDLWAMSDLYAEKNIACSGTVYASNLVNTSKAELKKNFRKLENALDIINAIDIYKYNYKTEEEGTKEHIGLVIGDGFKYSEEVTSKENKGVDTYSLISVCVKAIQEQQKEIETLKELLRGDKT